jgi:hypothetical protein
MPVTGNLQVSIVLFLGLSQFLEEGVDVPPFQVMRDRMLEDSFVGSQMRARERGRGVHLILKMGVICRSQKQTAEAKSMIPPQPHLLFAMSMANILSAWQL